MFPHAFIITSRKKKSIERYLFTFSNFASPTVPSALSLSLPRHPPPVLSSPLSLFFFLSFSPIKKNPFSPTPLTPLLLSASVEPLRLHRYSDCWLRRWSGMLFRHATRRYCTTLHPSLCPPQHGFQSSFWCSSFFSFLFYNLYKFGRFIQWSNAYFHDTLMLQRRMNV